MTITFMGLAAWVILIMTMCHGVLFDRIRYRIIALIILLISQFIAFIFGVPVGRFMTLFVSDIQSSTGWGIALMWGVCCFVGYDIVRFVQLSSRDKSVMIKFFMTQILFLFIYGMITAAFFSSDVLFEGRTRTRIGSGFLWLFGVIIFCYMPLLLSDYKKMKERHHNEKNVTVHLARQKAVRTIPQLRAKYRLDLLQSETELIELEREKLQLSEQKSKSTAKHKTSVIDFDSQLERIDNKIKFIREKISHMTDYVRTQAEIDSRREIYFFLKCGIMILGITMGCLFLVTNQFKKDMPRDSLPLSFEFVIISFFVAAGIWYLWNELNELDKTIISKNIVFEEPPLIVHKSMGRFLLNTGLSFVISVILIITFYSFFAVGSDSERLRTTGQNSAIIRLTQQIVCHIKSIYPDDLNVTVAVPSDK